MVQHLAYIRLCFWKLEGNLQIVLLDVLEFWYHAVFNETVRLILSCSITGPDAMDACLGMIPLIVPLLTHPSCRVFTIHIPTFRQQYNLSFRYTASASHPFTSFCFTLNVFFSWSRWFLLTKTVLIAKTRCFKQSDARSTKPISSRGVSRDDWRGPEDPTN